MAGAPLFFFGEVATGHSGVSRMFLIGNMLCYAC